MRLLREQVRRIGVLLCFSGAFVPGEVIFLAVAGPMGVSRQVAMLSSYLL
jgi:uncharacterized protein (DUF2344 family)